MIAALVVSAPVASAAGSGYSLTFTHGSGQSADGATDLVSLTTTDPGGVQITVTIQVSGTINVVSSHYAYTVYFGGSGSAASNAATAVFSNDTLGTWISSGGSAGFGQMAYSIGSGGSALTFSMNKSEVGPASSFTANAFAASDSSNSASWIGSDYTSTGGGGGSNCGLSACTTPASTAISWLVYAAIGFIVVIVVIVAVVLLVVMRRKKPPVMQTMPGQPPMMMGSPPPPPPPTNP
jgi:hypothetical protein